MKPTRNEPSYNVVGALLPESQRTMHSLPNQHKVRILRALIPAIEEQQVCREWRRRRVRESGIDV